MQVEDAGRKVLGRGASTDVIEASAKAYIDALNKLANLAGKL
jgi:2-isopropylmalate synthase